jgi:hypothetical protein
MKVVALLAVLFCAPAAPSLDTILRTDMVVDTKIRWSRLDDGKQVTVEIEGGEAHRINPNWSPDPAGLHFDLDRQRALTRLLRAAHLSSLPRGPRALSGPAAGVSKERQLEIVTLARSIEGVKWHTVGSWVRPVKSWQKGNLQPIFETLEPMLDEKPMLFGPMKSAPQ